MVSLEKPIHYTNIFLREGSCCWEASKLAGKQANLLGSNSRQMSVDCGVTPCFVHVLFLRIFAFTYYYLLRNSWLGNQKPTWWLWSLTHGWEVTLSWVALLALHHQRSGGLSLQFDHQVLRGMGWFFKVLLATKSSLGDKYLPQTKHWVWFSDASLHWWWQ